MGQYALFSSYLLTLVGLFSEVDILSLNRGVLITTSPNKDLMAFILADIGYRYTTLSVVWPVDASCSTVAKSLPFQQRGICLVLSCC